MIRLAKRMADLGTETAFEVLARAKALEAQGRSIVHLQIGEPDFDTPAHVVEAGAQALRNGHTHYTPSPGIPELRDAIAEDMKKSRGLDVARDEVVVTPGGKPILFNVILVLVDPGDEVSYPNPGFPIYESMIRFVGGKPVPQRFDAAKGFELDVDGLIASLNEKTKLLILNSPSNPTGGVIRRAELERIAKRVRELPNLVVLSDEIYSRLVYDGEKHFSIATLPGMRERTIILDGFSKTYAMTGWRLGYGVMPVELAKMVAKITTNSTSCTAGFTQMAGVAALRGPQDSAEAMCREFDKRRKIIVDGLNSVKGFHCATPKGAFYAFPDIRGTGRKSKELEGALLDECGVACLSGTSFGAFGEGFLRFSYANSVANLEEAIRRLRAYFGTQ
jgi:aspartate/methionine/tyrosine aminotransferase